MNQDASIGAMNGMMPNEAETATEIAQGAPTKTLEKGLFLLGLFDHDHPEWTLRELRERAGLPKATVRRLMKTAALRALYLATSHNELVRIIHPFLVSLTEETTETSILSVWTDQGPLILDTVPTMRSFKSLTFNGMLLEGLASADAQALIAFGPEEAWDRILAKPILPRTPHTVTDPQALREKWRAIRREGVAFDWSEWNADAPAVAVPLLDRRSDRASDRRRHAEARDGP
jgi:DNA-binding IclR family transcriptional regulator